ncbi:unnamed protein product [Brachionus calyciflorus]|uniref:Uncharacterized protein n=1 Tax=Brachionus calyciflorus TaxID=104777 RepID=A0A814BFG4_9BILA|nr:unnamed protein product [Brachionus calyciflorus]
MLSSVLNLNPYELIDFLGAEIPRLLIKSARLSESKHRKNSQNFHNFSKINDPNDEILVKLAQQCEFWHTRLKHNSYGDLEAKVKKRDMFDASGNCKLGYFESFFKTLFSNEDRPNDSEQERVKSDVKNYFESIRDKVERRNFYVFDLIYEINKLEYGRAPGYDLLSMKWSLMLKTLLCLYKFC